MKNVKGVARLRPVESERKIETSISHVAIPEKRSDESGALGPPPYAMFCYRTRREIEHLGPRCPPLDKRRSFPYSTLPLLSFSSSRIRRCLNNVWRIRRESKRGIKATTHRDEERRERKVLLARRRGPTRSPSS